MPQLADFHAGTHPERDIPTAGLTTVLHCMCCCGCLQVVCHSAQSLPLSWLKSPGSLKAASKCRSTCSEPMIMRPCPHAIVPWDLLTRGDTGARQADSIQTGSHPLQEHPLEHIKADNPVWVQAAVHSIFARRCCQQFERNNNLHNQRSHVLALRIISQ